LRQIQLKAVTQTEDMQCRRSSKPRLHTLRVWNVQS